MKRGRLALALPLVLAVALVLALGVSTGSAKQQATFKAAWIYVGPHDDHGWSQAHDQGRLYVQKQLGSKVQTTFKELVPEGPQTCQVIESLVRDGNKIIFATSFGFQNCMVSEAKKHPDVKFEQATGTAQSKNLAEYFGAGEDSIYLSGMAAGAATKKGTIGYVVPFAIPEVIRHANAFALGAQVTHPGAKVRLIWTNSWLDLSKEKKAAQSLVGAGADVLGQNVDSPATGQYAKSKNVPWVGYDSDAHTFAPKQWLTAAVYDWGKYYVRRVQAAINGTWKPGFYYGSVKDGFTGLAAYGPKVSAKTKAAIAAKKQQILSGKWHAFCGPIYDQGGKLKIAKGKCLDPNTKAGIDALYSMQWLVKGVAGSVSHVQPPG
jgi:basic membrane protein A and related proteins